GAAGDGAAGDGAAGDGAAGDGAASVLRLEAEDFRDLARLSRELWLRPKPTEVERLTLAIESRLGQLRPCPPSQVPHGGHAGVRRARRLAESIESEVLDVAELAREAGVSTSRLSHLFQDGVGVSPLQYLNYCRVQAFVRRWDGEQDNLLTAALAAGFGSYAKFHRVFSQVCGSSPRAHRRFLLEKSIDPSQRLGNVPPSQPPSQPPRVRATGWSSARV
ncbi:MAG TPA: AraC family transcriptional regulator, partial [Polyangiaceae bacterium]|nr:AraC family transcriptional regulator [Polyangiaceae bacterium]